MKTIEAPKRSWFGNIFFYWMGLGVLVLNKLRYALRGYRSPRPFPVSEIDQAVEHDLEVARHMEGALRTYLDEPSPFAGRTVLELGPGADLGVGLALLSKRARRYIGFDIHHLAQNVPRALYDRLLARLPRAREIEPELERTLQGQADRLEYRWDAAFDLSSLKEEGVDLVMGNASFEHLSDVEETLEHLTEIVEPGTVLVSEVDLQTHTQVLRARDPLNIYRFAPWIYNRLKFQGSPNRVRPETYRRLLKKLGWRDIKIFAGTVTSSAHCKSVRPYVTERFRAETDLNTLNFVLCARFVPDAA